jgi:hemolysin III
MFAISIYLLSLLSMYGTSTLYHLLAGERVKRLFQILDHISIYLLIAGTNTYFISRYIESDVALIFLLVQWSLVLGGIIFKVFYTGRFDVISTFFYIALGLMAVLLIRSLWYNMPLTVFAWIIAGGAFYILGTIFYLWQKLRFHHAIWHLFVFGGTVSHYVALIYGL